LGQRDCIRQFDIARGMRFDFGADAFLFDQGQGRGIFTAIAIE